MSSNHILIYSVLDSSEEWPVFCYYVRNIGPICAQCLNFINSSGLQVDNVDSLNNIRSLAQITEYSDTNNQFLFRIVCTDSDNKSLGLIKYIKERFSFVENFERFEMLVPMLVIASRSEAEYLLNCPEIMSHSAAVVLLSETEEEENTTEDHVWKHLLYTTATVEEMFAKIDKYLLERLVFKLVRPMVDYLQNLIEENIENSECKLPESHLYVAEIVFLLGHLS